MSTEETKIMALGLYQQFLANLDHMEKHMLEAKKQCLEQVNNVIDPHTLQMRALSNEEIAKLWAALSPVLNEYHIIAQDIQRSICCAAGAVHFFVPPFSEGADSSE